MAASIGAARKPVPLLLVVLLTGFACTGGKGGGGQPSIRSSSQTPIINLERAALASVRDVNVSGHYVIARTIGEGDQRLVMTGEGDIKGTSYQESDQITSGKSKTTKEII